jgi:predicted transcriptional regulator
MRGWTTDFYTMRYTEPVTFSVYPSDFNCDEADAYLDQPDAPEIVECRNCDPVACNRMIRQSGNTLKPDCAAFLSLDGLGAPRKPATRLPATEFRSIIINALRGGAVMSLYEIMDATGLTYGTTRNYVYQLLNEGQIAHGGWRNTVSASSRGQLRLYCLPEYRPADATERPPRKPRKSNQAKERCAIINAKLLAILREQGRMESSRLAELLDLSASITRKKLRDFEKQGLVRQAAVEKRRCESGKQYTVTLWEIVEG